MAASCFLFVIKLLSKKVELVNFILEKRGLIKRSFDFFPCSAIAKDKL